MDAAQTDILAAALADYLKPLVREAVREEMAALTGRSSPSGEDFFKRLNEEIMGSLGDIYRELSTFQGPGAPSGNPEDMAQAGEIMEEASQRLDQVIQATEKATFEIIELVERNMSAPDELLSMISQAVCDTETQSKASAICKKLSEDMVEIMTCLSFQDLTGQRIKRVIDMLGKVRDMIAELYVSTGLLMKAKEREPAQPLEELKKDARSKVSQSEVDDLLAQLNM